MIVGTVFFLPRVTRPKEFPPLKGPMTRHKYWHTGVISGRKVYETFNSAKFNISDEVERRLELVKQKAIFLTAKIDPKKLQSEIKSGCSCDQYVLRCLGLSRLTGADKGKLFPDDVYNIVHRGAPPINFPKNEWGSIQVQLNKKGYVYTTRVSNDIRLFKVDNYMNAPWDDLLIVEQVKRYNNIEDHPFFDNLTDAQKEEIEENIRGSYIVVKLVRT